MRINSSDSSVAKSSVHEFLKYLPKLDKFTLAQIINQPCALLYFELPVKYNTLVTLQTKRINSTKAQNKQTHTLIHVHSS